MPKEIPKDPAKVQRILAAAIVEFGTHGYNAAHTDEIAVTAKVSKGLIFHYFKNKQGLYLATVDQLMATLYAELQPAKLPVPGDLVALMVQSTQLKTEFGQRHPLGMKVMIDAFGQIDKLPVVTQKKIMQVYQEQLKVSRTRIRRIVAKLPLRESIDPETIIDLVLGLTNQVFTEFQDRMRGNADLKSMADMQWLVERAKKYMQIIEYGALTDKTPSSGK